MTGLDTPTNRPGFLVCELPAIITTTIMLINDTSNNNDCNNDNDTTNDV